VVFVIYYDRVDPDEMALHSARIALR
jgi:hypothetical protein